MLNKLNDILQSRRLQQILLSMVFIFLGFHLVMLSTQASELIPFPSAWDGLSGYARFLSPSLHYDLDIQVLSWNDPIEKSFFALATFLFELYKNFTKLFVIAYYYISTFELYELMKPAVLLMFTALKRTFIDDFRGFLTSFLLLGVAVHYGKQNFQKMVKTILSYFIIIAIAGVLVTQSNSIYTKTFSTIQEINGAVTTSVLGAGDDIGDPHLEATGAFWYSLFVEPYTEVNGEGKLSLSQMENMVQYESGSEERDNLIKMHNEDSGIFARSFLNSVAKSISFVVVSIVVLIEVCVIVVIAAVGIVQQLMLIIMFALLPIVMALSTIEFFGGLNVLRRYGITAAQTLLTMIMIGVILGFTSLFDGAIASTSYPWLVKIIFRAIIYVSIYLFRDKIFDMLSRLIGLRTLGYNPALDMPYIANRGDDGNGGGRKSKKDSKEDSSDDSSEGQNSNTPPEDMPRPQTPPPGKGNRNSSIPRDMESPQSNKEVNPTNKQMKYARDLERKFGIDNPQDLSELSPGEMKKYIDDLEAQKLGAKDMPKDLDSPADNRVTSKQSEERNTNSNTEQSDSHEEEQPHELNAPNDIEREQANLEDIDKVDQYGQSSEDENSSKPAEDNSNETDYQEYGDYTSLEAPQEEKSSEPVTRSRLYKHKHKDLYKASEQSGIDIDHIDLDLVDTSDREQLLFELQSGYDGGIIRTENERQNRTKNSYNSNHSNPFEADFEQVISKYKKD